ncbi:hypothetical protein KKE68_07185 [Patescibacteria group bacterium]|nr:hypothetical protein [Patescibacteria group bacterium]
MNKYNFYEEQLRRQLIEAILQYFEGNTTLQSVIDLGFTAYNKKISKDSDLAEVVSQLNAMGYEIVDGKNFPGESINKIFTTMLEKLISD